MYPVQPIAVKPSTHFETIAAAAIASNLMFAAADRSSEPWKGWLEQSYGKNVRNIRRPAEAGRLAAMEGHRTVFTVGSATAYAFGPLGYADFPAPLKKLQVTGLELPRTPDSFRVPGMTEPEITISDDARMSTGKTAAQVAHALMLWVLEQDDAAINRWMLSPGLRLAYGSLANAAGHGATVIDNGHTELEPGTATVRVALEHPAQHSPAINQP